MKVIRALLDLPDIGGAVAMMVIGIVVFCGAFSRTPENGAKYVYIGTVMVISGNIFASIRFYMRKRQQASEDKKEIK